MITLSYVPSQNNLADFLTKPVGRSRIVQLLQDYTLDVAKLVASPLSAPSMGGCQDLAKGPDDNAECDKFIAEAINQIGSSPATVDT
ncbi:hypothetical protein PCANC_26934 [Puccinia coronata f. sp. avenae]|uniref:Uncharacterized protein n=1 Tax=Puccinia coronata f. sp. avenae TaxID=200324 RepID=A0A2N5U2S1_9BASI|nr:hypothetical protein PCANC_26934 [Puccinia coronata f. sp. avenae]